MLSDISYLYCVSELCSTHSRITGYVQTFTAPVSGYYQVYLAAPNGDGNAEYNNDAHGLGSQLQADYYFEQNETIYILIGGYSSGYGNQSDPKRGWNGGGPGFKDKKSGSRSSNGAGATDIRTESAGDKSTDARTGFNSRIMVAGGGCGGANNNASFTANSSSLWYSGAYSSGGGYYAGSKQKSGSCYWMSSYNEHNVTNKSFRSGGGNTAKIILKVNYSDKYNENKIYPEQLSNSNISE